MTKSNTQSTLEVLSYNVNGIKNYVKSKRIINKLIKYSQSKTRLNTSYIICLQETHLLTGDIPAFSNRWRFGNAHSVYCDSTRGVAVLWLDHQWDQCLGSDTDQDGRIVSVTLSKDGRLYSFINIYAPVLSSGDSISFTRTLSAFLSDLTLKFPTTQVVLAGDFNHTASATDYTNRNVTQTELATRSGYESIISSYSLVDLFRTLHSSGGYTWGYKNKRRAAGLSRLDRILVAGLTHSEVVEAKVLPEFDSSDHALLIGKFLIYSQQKCGPGYFKLYQSTYQTLSSVQAINDMIDTAIQMSAYYNDPSLRWDFIKCYLRSQLMLLQKIQHKKHTSSLSALEDELNKLHVKLPEYLEQQLIDYSPERELWIRMIRNEIARLTVSVNKLRTDEAELLIKKSRSQWAEEGERSTKYFLNLIKTRKAKSIINKIIVNGIEYTDTHDILDKTTEYYSSLYNPWTTTALDNNDIAETFLTNLPQVDTESKTLLDTPLTIKDLSLSLNTMKDSAPGPDGFPYSFYKTFSTKLLPLLLDSWLHSLEQGVLTLDMRTSFYLSYT